MTKVMFNTWCETSNVIIQKWRPVHFLHTDELKRSIGLFQAITYGVGLILGAGIYVIIGDVAAIAGNAMWISFIFAP